MRRILLSTLFFALALALASCQGMYSNSSGGGSSPSITSLNPTSGAVGTSVTITGTNFGSTQGYSTVAFNGTAATPTSWSATSIVAPVPTGATTGNVVVTVGGLASNGVAFTVTTVAPSITNLNPASGAVGTSVTITGTNFGTSQGSSTVTFNGTAATSTNWSATSVVAPVPTGATTGNVVVTVAGVASNGMAFTVTTAPAPSITSLNPTSGAVGTSVTITGTNFGSTQGSSTVTFNGTAAAPTSWSTTSIVVPVPAGATTGNVVVTVGGVASNGVSFTVTSTVPKFPVKASANGRYFTDANGVPWLMVADAAHHLISDLPASSIPTYLSNRQSHGFNAINAFAMCSGTSNCPASGGAADGTLPFTTGTAPSTYDLSTPNNAFWTEVDNLITQANADGLIVVLCPIPWGAGFSSTFQNNGATKVFNFGAYLGNRYKGFSNLIWHLGQDFTGNTLPSASNVGLMAQLMAGIASTDPNHLQMVQLNYNGSYSIQASSLNSTYTADLTSDFVYTYYETYGYTLSAYNASPALPIFLGEDNYETANNTNQLPGPATAQVLRYQMWWTMTSGAAGFEWGNAHVSHFDSSWQTNLDTTATTQVKYLTSLFAQFPWWNLVPDQSHQIVTAGYGTQNPSNLNLATGTYATTTWVPGSLAIVYTPVLTTLSVNMANFSKPVTASWYDPTTGNSTAIGTFANAGTQTFTTPGTAHADGTHDWVLVLQ